MTTTKENVMDKDHKVYYVTGKDFMGNTRTIKTYARTPAEARYNAGWILVKPGVVRRY
jgi:hypothetical protein